MRYEWLKEKRPDDGINYICLVSTALSLCWWCLPLLAALPVKGPVGFGYFYFMQFFAAHGLFQEIFY